MPNKQPRMQLALFVLVNKHTPGRLDYLWKDLSPTVIEKIVKW